MEFYSDSYYISLPTLKNKKVELAIDNRKIIKNSFKLYNPFSSRAKLLKNIVYFFIYNFGFIIRLFMLKKTKTNILNKILENKKNITSSIYYSRDYSKVIIQVQTLDGDKLFYIKVGINELGKKRIKNEYDTLNFLENNSIIQFNYITSYLNTDKLNYIYMNPIEGKTNVLLKERELKIILEKFKTINIYAIQEHPEIKQINKELSALNDANILRIFNSIMLKYSYLKCFVVFEHGDMAPWNIYNNNGNIKFIDFELSIINGIENIDLISYFYQFGNLIIGKNDIELYKFLQEQVKIENLNLFLILFIIKTILKRIRENFDYEHEINLLNVIYKKEMHEL